MLDKLLIEKINIELKKYSYSTSIILTCDIFWKTQITPDHCRTFVSRIEGR